MSYIPAGQNSRFGGTAKTPPPAPPLPPTAPSAPSINFPTGTYQYGTTPAGSFPSSFPGSPSAPSAPSPPNITSPESGLWIGVALGVGILLSGTQVAPLVFGILVVGTIYQLQQLLQGK